MADTKISALAALTGANVTTSTDVFAIVDTDAAATKKILVSELFLADASLTFTGTLTGCTTTPTVDVTYRITNGVVSLFIPLVTATSNTTAMTMTGAPAAVRPATIHNGLSLIIRDNGSSPTAPGRCDVGTDGVLTFYVDFGGTGWTASGTKGLPNNTQLVYDLT